MLVVRRGFQNDIVKIICEIEGVSYKQLDEGDIQWTHETAPTRLTDFSEVYERLL